MKGTRQKIKKKYSALLLFICFTLIALGTIVLLEYLDYQKGEDSFIFSRLFPLENREQKIRLFSQRLQAILKVNNIPHDSFLDNRHEYHFKMDIEYAHYDKLVAKIRTVAKELKGELELVEIQGMANKSIMLFHVLLGKRKTHILLITRLNAAPMQAEKPGPVSEEPRPVDKKIPSVPTEQPKPASTPRLAIIIDDVGAYDIGPLEIKRLGVPITVSILPDSSFAADSAYWAGEYQLDALIHLPMQPNNSRNNGVGSQQEITLNSSDAEIRALIRRAKQVIPQARGCNNHQGSLITATPDIMFRVLKIIKEEGLFFVDSRTIGSTVAFKLAKQLQIPTAHKDIFIDHIQTYANSMEQIRKLVDLARQNGQAIAIGHPFDTTIRALRDSIDYIRSKGVEIVPVADLLE